MVLPALALGLALTEPGPLVLDAPADRTVVRGDPVELPLRLAPGQDRGLDLQIELDGELCGYLLPWTETLTLEPGLHRLRIHGHDRQHGAPLTTATVEIAVFDEAPAVPLDANDRNAWVAFVALALAVASATALRKRGQL